MNNKFSLKDKLFNVVKIKYLAGMIKGVYPKFDDSSFVANICNELPNLELKQRIFCITDKFNFVFAARF